MPNGWSAKRPVRCWSCAIRNESLDGERCVAGHPACRSRRRSSDRDHVVSGGKERMRRLMSVIAQGRVALGHMVTHRFALDQIEEAYELFANQREAILKVAL